MAKSKKSEVKADEENGRVDSGAQSHQKCHKIKFVFDVFNLHRLEFKLTFSHRSSPTSHILAQRQYSGLKHL